MSRIPFCIIIVLTGIQLLGVSSCKHEPFFSEEDMIPVDTTSNPIDTSGTTPTDTTNNGIPCDTSMVYFQLEVLPILISNCATSGCHDATSAKEGVILDGYASVMSTADIEAFDLNGSKLYKIITEDDVEDRMPPSPDPPLSNEQIELIAKWILQGAKDLECDPDAAGCDTQDVSYSNFVKPTIQNHCQGCHSGSTPDGGIDLSTYSGVKTVADNGKLYGVASRADGFSPMPQGGAKLPDCTIDKIKAWIDAGAQEN